MFKKTLPANSPVRARPGHSNVRTRESVGTFQRPAPFQLAAPEDGRTPMRPGIDLPPVARKIARMLSPVDFKNVTAVAKANVYFDGKVVSHTILLPDGAKKTLGLIYPGTYHFGTDAAELMEITAGACTVTLDGESDSESYDLGSSFDVPAKSGFTITVESGICEYICSFLP